MDYPVTFVAILRMMLMKQACGSRRVSRISSVALDDGGIEIAKMVTREPEKAPSAASAPESWGAHHGPEADILAGLKEPFQLEDRSKAVHNGTYTMQILYDTLQALDPRFDVSGRPK
jgi:hypothetical protein